MKIQDITKNRIILMPIIQKDLFPNTQVQKWMSVLESTCQI